MAFSLVKISCCLHVTATYLIDPAIVGGPSMLPTMGPMATFLLTERNSLRFGKVERGDIVLVRSPVNPRNLLTKRLLGLEGDSVTFLVDPRNSDKCETIVVPKGHVWVQGDNIYNSRDSRQFGSVPYGLLYAKVFWRLWPLGGFGPLGKN
ncbi:mitochondrial inner membrane protease subunit 1 [Neltuma alba]|uniref:mitochondrial inner membrane protease subunit 1 n=1 Tax=Neltuma alba TaxID=207710 RepID=UPI0010A469D0|nr:mitochondrial inner membrane protease subunit 1-like [Prosopis alba]